MPQEEKSAYEGGATRTKLELRYDLLPVSGVRALARRITLGAERHGPDNWRGGGPAFYQATKNHLVNHVLNFLATDSQEDLDAIICNASFLTEYKLTGQDKREPEPTGGCVR